MTTKEINELINSSAKEVVEGSVCYKLREEYFDLDHKELLEKNYNIVITEIKFKMRKAYDFIVLIVCDDVKRYKELEKCNGFDCIIYSENVKRLVDDGFIMECINGYNINPFVYNNQDFIKVSWK